ncbi:MAG TPA: hypothetical protein DCQ96_13750 [Verrucomicrobiales bacterium]|nr:hypothetical protein [Verrucomicrobiales bacterium]
MKPPESKETPEAPSPDSFELFVRDPSDERPEYPVKFALFGALGDLALSRINHQVHEYTSTVYPKSLREVYFCGRTPDYDRSRFIGELYSKCKDNHQLESYFTRSFLDNLEQAGDTGEPNSKDLEQGVIDAHTNSETEILTSLGQFLVANYCATGTAAEFDSVFTNSQIIDSDWIFYLALPPTAYADTCRRIRDKFRDAAPHSEASNTRKLILLEKPFQTTLEEATDLARDLETMEEESLGLQFYSVDHYAAKWTLSRLPAMVHELQTFRDIVSNTERVVIDLSEKKTIPTSRTGYMASTGLFNDMMPHALVALQFLFAGKSVVVRRDRSECLAVGSEENFMAAADQIQTDGGAAASLNLETYFSIKIELRVSEPDGSCPRTVMVYIRSAKALIEENKKIHIIPRRDEDDLPFFTIDIAEEDFPEPTAEEGYPESMTDGDVAKGEQRGYSKILFDAISFLRRNKFGEDCSLSPPLEFLTPKQSVEVIRNMVDIKNCLLTNHARDHAGADPFQNPLSYSAGISWLDEKKESPILSPLTPGE